MGDVISVYGDVDYDGFYRGELAGRRGLVPSNFLRPASAADAAPRPRHPPGPASPLPPTAVPDDGPMARGPGLVEPSYGQPPVASLTPTGSTAVPLHTAVPRGTGDVALSTPVAVQPSCAVDPRDLAMSAPPAYAGRPEILDERIQRSGQTYRR